MNLSVFPISSTNIFPIANSLAGGQLLTEFNLKSRESVATDPEVKYDIGSSFTHSLDDFRVTQVPGLPEIMIAPGKALVNGHFIQSLAPIQINIDECNAEAISRGEEPISGDVAVGLRIVYSTEQTMRGAMLAEPHVSATDVEYGMYPGIQVVILPAAGQVGEKLTLPSDTPTDESKVNAHLKLATFTYKQGEIVNLQDNVNRIQSISAERIGDIDALVSDAYVSREGLNPDKLYVFAGKTSEEGLPTWCAANESLMIWGPLVQRQSGVTTLPSAAFLYDSTSDSVKLDIPRKDTYDHGSLKFPDLVLPLPKADYANGTGGTITKEIIQRIANLQGSLDNYGQLIAMLDLFLGYAPVLDAPLPNTLTELADLVEGGSIDPSKVHIGAYVLVGSDYTITEDTSDVASIVSTLYVLVDYQAGTDNELSWGGPVRLTGSVPLAQEEIVGGFLNVPQEALGQGYVWRDNNGNLKLLDFDLLKTGVLAYQLGQDQHISGDTAEIQQQLDSLVNERVAFPSSYTSGGSRIINVYIQLPDEYTSGDTITVRDVDSRFNTCLYLHFFRADGSSANFNQLEVVVENCERVRYDIGEGCNEAHYTLHNSSLYFDADIIDELENISGMRLWYEQFNSTDSALLINGMTVEYVGELSGADVADMDPFSLDTPNDNHYSWGLKSVTFAGDGTVEGLGIMVQDRSTNNVAMEGTFLLYAPFTTTSNSGLSCPTSKITRDIRVSGSFVSAYIDNTATPATYMINEITFTAVPQVVGQSQEGQIAFESNVKRCSNVAGVGSLTAMLPDTWHYFEGRASK